MYNQQNTPPQNPAGIMPQGQRPHGFGRPSNLPPQGGTIPQPGMQNFHSGYQPQPGYVSNISYLSRLAAQIPLNQNLHGMGTVETAGEGFNAYSYQREQRQQQRQQQPQSQNSFFGDLNQPQPGQNVQAEQEAQQQLIKEYSARAANKIYEQLHNKMNRPYETVKNTLLRFKQPQNGVADGVIGEYVNEIDGNIQLYRYCCSYTCIIMTALFTEQVQQGRAEEIERNEEMLASMLHESFLTVIALQFLDWLEKHPRGMLMVSRLLPKTLQNIEYLESRMGGIESTILSVGDMRQPIAFPWRKGTLQRIRQTVEAGAGTYDFYAMYNSGEQLQTNWGQQSTMSQHNNNTPPSGDYEEPTWYQEYKKALFADEGGTPNVYSSTSSYGRTSDIMMLNPVNDNWAGNNRVAPAAPTPPPAPVHHYVDREPPRPVEPEQVTEKDAETYLERKAMQLTQDNSNTANLMEWFVKLPDGGADQYIVHPRYFKHIAKILRYEGREVAYERLGIGEDYLPIVSLDGRNYNYELLYVGSANMQWFLTKPQHVLPQLKEVKDNREKYIQVYNDYIEDLNTTVSPAEKEADKNCREMKKEPKVVHTNVPIVSQSNEGCIQSVRQVVNLVGRKYKKRPDAIIIPAETLKPIEIVDAPDFNYDQIEEHLSYLVTGYKPSGNVGTYLLDIVRGIGEIGSPMLKYYVEEHLTDVFNRWLVERRFYAPVGAKEGEFVKVDNIIDDHVDLIELLLSKNDKESVALLNSMGDEDFFIEHLPLFASRKRQEEYIESETSSIADAGFREAKIVSLNASVLLQREFVIAHVDPMTPLESQDRVVMEGSQYPELRWLLQNAPRFGKSHFGMGRRVPVVVMFNQDIAPRMWATTFSPFCTHKFTLRQLTLNKPLPLLKVM